MKAASFLRVLALASTLAPLVVLACADDNTLGGDVGDKSDADAPPSTVPGVDGSAPEHDSAAPVDAAGGGADAADADAPKRTCTGEDWCHTAVPDNQIYRDVWGDGQGAVWTVSEQGNIL